MINNILSHRLEKIKFIQKKFRNHLTKKKLFSFAKQHKKYYSIYPSFRVPTQKNEKLLIKLFIDYYNNFNYKILPLRFCQIRNCYVFDIPKTKFLTSKKIMRFYFILNNKKIYDKQFDIISFGNTNVNQIDFVRYDKKERLLYKKFKQDFASNIYSSESSFSDFDYSEEDKNKNTATKKIKTKKFVSRNETSMNFSSSLSTRNSFKTAKITSVKHSKVKSILKDKGSFKNLNESKFNSSERRVSFGIVKFSY